MEDALSVSRDAEEAALLVRYAKGDRQASGILTHRLTPGVFSLALRLLGDRGEAEDVTQEAMLRLWKIAPRWRTGEAKPSTWLYRVTFNLATDRLRKRRTVPLCQIDEPVDGLPAADERMHRDARARALRAALGKLPDRQRQAVVLRHLEGLANPEIAGMMGLSVAAVESLTARGKRKLAQLLSGRRDELGLSE